MAPEQKKRAGVIYAEVFPERQKQRRELEAAGVTFFGA
jgi:hypothetical protein